MNGTEKPYSAKEIILDLGISDSNLRKWCLALEEAGYSFSRTTTNKRLFYMRDNIVLKQLQHLVQVQNMSVQNAAIIVATKYKEDLSVMPNTTNTDTDVRSGSEIIQELFERIGTLEEQQNELLDINKKLVEQLGEQKRYIEERLDKRERTLTESLKESLEIKKLLIEQSEQKKKKGIFKFFS